MEHIYQTGALGETVSHENRGRTILPGTSRDFESVTAHLKGVQSRQIRNDY